MLTLQFVPYADIEKLDTQGRIDKLLKIVKENKIVLMQGRLKPEEEMLLIQQTMQQIHKDFKGVETCTIYPEEKNLQLFNRFRKEMVKYLVGHRDGITIIGPSTVVKEIRRDPNKIQLLTISSTARSMVRSRKTPVRRKVARRTVKRPRVKRRRR